MNMDDQILYPGGNPSGVPTTSPTECVQPANTVPCASGSPVPAPTPSPVPTASVGRTSTPTPRPSDPGPAASPSVRPTPTPVLIPPATATHVGVSEPQLPKTGADLGLATFGLAVLLVGALVLLLARRLARR